MKNSHLVASPFKAGILTRQTAGVYNVYDGWVPLRWASSRPFIVHAPLLTWQTGTRIRMDPLLCLWPYLCSCFDKSKISTMKRYSGISTHMSPCVFELKIFSTLVKYCKLREDPFLKIWVIWHYCTWTPQAVYILKGNSESEPESEKDLLPCNDETLLGIWPGHCGANKQTNKQVVQDVNKQQVVQQTSSAIILNIKYKYNI